MRTLMLTVALLATPSVALADVIGGCGGGGAPEPDECEGEGCDTDDTDAAGAWVRLPPSALGLAGGGLVLLGLATMRRRDDGMVPAV